MFHKKVAPSLSISTWRFVLEPLFVNISANFLDIILATNVVRILVKLESTKQQSYQMEYHYHLQGLIYNMLKGSKYSQIHDKEGYKFFCFSNIFPAYDLKQGDVRHLLISSPDRDFVRHISSKLNEKNGLEKRFPSAAWNSMSRR